MISIANKNLVLLSIVFIALMALYSKPILIAEPGPNETYTVVNTLAFGATKSLKPSPELTYGTFFPYVLFFLYGITYLAGFLTGIYQSVSDFSMQFFLNPKIFYSTGRYLSAFFGCATLFMTYYIGSRFFNKRVGWIAAILVFLNNVFFLRCQLVTIETTLAFFCLVFLYFLFQIIENADTKYFIFAGVAYGVILATKMTGVFFVAGLPIAYLLSQKDQYIRVLYDPRLFYFAFIAMGVFFILHPYFFLDFDHYYALLVREKDKGLYLSRGMESYPYIWFFTRSVRDNPVLGITYILGIGFCFFSKERRNWVIYTIIFAYVVMVGRQKLHYMHFMFSIIPLISLLSSQLIDTLLFRSDRSIYRISGYIVLCIFIFYSLQGLWNRTALRMEKSARVMAAEWINNNISKDKLLAIDNYEKGPNIITAERYFSKSRLQKYESMIPEKFKEKLMKKFMVMGAYKTIRVKYYAPEPQWPSGLAKSELADLRGNLFWERRFKVEFHGIKELAEIGADYLILADFKVSQRNKFQNKYPKGTLLYYATQRELNFYRNVIKSNKLRFIKSFQGAGNTIAIYQILKEPV